MGSSKVLKFGSSGVESEKNEKNSGNMKTDLPQRDSAGADGFVVVPSVSDGWIRNLPLR